MKMLNNLVTELANITEFPKKSYSEWTFTNPREGWVFISSTASAEGSDRTHIALDAVPSNENLLVHQATASDTLEAMRYLPAGEHKLRVRSEGKPTMKSLIVRTIPELIFCKFQYNPHISSMAFTTGIFWRSMCCRTSTPSSAAAMRNTSHT